MTLDIVAVALGAGVLGGAIGGVAIGVVQAWMARGTTTRIHSFRQRAAPASWQGSARVSLGTPGRFDRFNESGKRVLALAQEEAIRQNHNYIGTEHLLAALVRDGDTLAARALQSLGMDLEKVRTALELIIGRGEQPTTPSEITLSPRTKKVIELSIDEARDMGDHHVGAEHIILGIVREGEGIASGIIESLGVTLPTVRAEVLEQLASSGRRSPRGERASGPFTRFSDRAKRVLAFAQDEAIRMGHTYIGPEHLLLGLGRLAQIGQPDEPMNRIFDRLGLTLERLRAELGKVIPPSDRASLPTEITLSPETKEIIRIVSDSAAEHFTVPEDLLLAIVRDPQSFAAQILERLGVTAERVRAAIGR